MRATAPAMMLQHDMREAEPSPGQGMRRPKEAVQ